MAEGMMIAQYDVNILLFFKGLQPQVDLLSLLSHLLNISYFLYKYRVESLYVVDNSLQTHRLVGSYTATRNTHILSDFRFLLKFLQ